MLCTLKKTVDAIVSSGNHYCIGLKANQPKLLEQAQHCAQTQPASSCAQSLDTTHGRVVQRCVKVFAAPATGVCQQWAGLAAFAQVERTGVREGEAFERRSWFILSQEIAAEEVAKMIQGHRGTIENQVHWVKDVVQGEDGSLLCGANAATLMAVMRTWTISLFRRAGHKSITKARRSFCHNLPVLLSFI
jgi:predicted transposase YbfD/YdcC